MLVLRPDLPVQPGHSRCFSLDGLVRTLASAARLFFGGPFGLDLVVGMAVLVDRGQLVDQPEVHVLELWLELLAETGILEIRNCHIVSEVHSLGKWAAHSVMKILSEVWGGFPTFIRAAMALLGSMCAEILKPCCELEHTGRHFCWQCVQLIDQVNPGSILTREDLFPKHEQNRMRAGTT